jgi:hypothetical protein
MVRHIRNVECGTSPLPASEERVRVRGNFIQ